MAALVQNQHRGVSARTMMVHVPAAKASRGSQYYLSTRFTWTIERMDDLLHVPRHNLYVLLH